MTKIPAEETSPPAEVAPVEPKTVNIGIEEKPLMINVHLDLKESIDESFVDFFKIIPICLLRPTWIDPTIVRHGLHINPLIKSVKKSSKLAPHL